MESETPDCWRTKSAITCDWLGKFVRTKRANNNFATNMCKLITRKMMSSFIRSFLFHFIFLLLYGAVHSTYYVRAMYHLSIDSLRAYLPLPLRSTLAEYIRFVSFSRQHLLNANLLKSCRSFVTVIVFFVSYSWRTIKHEQSVIGAHTLKNTEFVIRTTTADTHTYIRTITIVFIAWNTETCALDSWNIII